jgi:uncharacterized protein (TIGR03000 family)
MSRHLLTTAVLLVLPTIAFAQFRGGSGFGGGVRPVSPTMGPISPGAMPISPGAAMPRFRPGTGVAGGVVHPGHLHTPGVWGWQGGWFPFYGYNAPLYAYPVPVEVPVPVPVVVQPPEPPFKVSGEAAATLVLEFPAAAEVWVNDKKGEGDPHTEWTLTSPALPIGTEYTFKVKAIWKTGGKTYQYEKTVTVAAGNRSKALVVAGTEIKE